MDNAEFISQYDKNMWVVPLSKLADAPSVASRAITTVDTLLIAAALRDLAQDSERNMSDRKRAEELREQVLAYGASMCQPVSEPRGDDIIVRSNIYPFKVVEPDGERIEE